MRLLLILRIPPLLFRKLVLSYFARENHILPEFPGKNGIQINKIGITETWTRPDRSVLIILKGAPVAEATRAHWHTCSLLLNFIHNICVQQIKQL